MKKILTMSIVTISFIIFFIVGNTYALFSSKDEINNAFSTINIDVKIEEEFIPSYSLATKKVQVRNNSQSDCLIRVLITARWVDAEGNPFLGDVSSNTINFILSEFVLDELNDSQGKWFKGNDEYYYYIGKLKGEQLTPVLLERVEIKEGIILDDRYIGKELIVDVTTEAVQATKYDVDGDGIVEYQFEDSWVNISEDIKNIYKKIINS